jgi:ADP-ribosyltransferase exoenzyme
MMVAHPRNALLVLFLPMLQACLVGPPASADADEAFVAMGTTRGNLAAGLRALTDRQGPPVYLSAGLEGGSRSAFFVPSAVDARHRLALDFTGVASLLPSGTHSKNLCEALALELAGSGGQPRSGQGFDDDAFAARALQAASAQYMPDAKVEGIFRALKARRSECNASGAPATISKRATTGEQDAIEYSYSVDCGIFKRQASGFALSLAELVAIAEYSGNAYSPISGLLRTAKADATRATPIDAASGLWALLMTSGLRKLDRHEHHAYRGVAAAYPACGSAVTIATPKPPSSPSPIENERYIRALCRYYNQSQTLRDCSFVSASADPGVALKFAGVGELANIDSNGHVKLHFAGDGAPSLQPAQVVLELEGRTGIDLTGISSTPYEREILWPAGTPFRVKPSGAKIAISSNKIERYSEVSYAAHALVDCDAPLTAEQKSRITHVRVHAVEQD